MAYRVADFDVVTVQRADGERAVHGEFHVTRAGRLLAGRGDLFRQIGGRIHAVAVLDVEVRQKHHLENVGDHRLLIDGRGDGVDQLYDQLGHAVSGSRLAAEDHSTRWARGG